VLIAGLPSSALAGLVINEVDYEQPGADHSEFVELFNNGCSAVSTANLAVVLMNGTNNSEYARVNLPAMTLSPRRYFVVGSQPVLDTIPGTPSALFPNTTDNLQNGAPDGVGLFDLATSSMLDVLSYEGAITAGQVTGVPGTFDFVEGTATTAADDATGAKSLIRSPNGQDTGDASADWAVSTQPSPGAANTAGPGQCPPILAAIGDRSVDEAQTLSFTVSATDPDPQDTLTLSATNLPSGSTFDPATGAFSWTPTRDQAGAYPDVGFSVSDGTLTDSEQITITVVDVPAPPANPAPAPTPSPAPGAPTPTAPVVTKRSTRITARVSKTRKALRVKGVATPNRAQTKLTVTLFRKRGRTFRRIGVRRPVMSEASGYRATFARPRPGSCRITTSVPGDTRHEAISISRTFRC
jgi:hypothetical protein